VNEQVEILVVDDEASVIEVIGLYLRREGYSVSSAKNGNEALDKLGNSLPALIILDVMLPEVDGLEILRRLRARNNQEVPVILLTARGQEVDRIYGLELGADDYVVKPFSPAELVARVKAVLRRSNVDGFKESTDKQLEYDDLTINPLTREVLVHDHAVELTATEFNLLYFLAGHPRQVFSRDALLERVWGYSEYVDSSTVTVHIRRLREKIEAKPSEPSKLETIDPVNFLSSCR